MPVRALDTVSDITKAVELQRTVWRAADIDVVPVTEIIAAAHNDGIVIGSFDGDDLTGFAFSMVGRRNGRFLQYSRMLAVHPDRRGQGLGALLKLEQKRIAVEKGYTWMEWTFDPLEARNARLNLRRLGARVRHYHVDYYGTRSSQFDLGVPTDRFLAEWDLAEDIERTGPARRAAARDAVPAFEVLDVDAVPRPGPPAEVSRTSGAALLIPLPSRFQPIRESSTELAIAWRLAVREAARAAFANGYAVVDFLPDLPGAPGCGAHVLVREEARA